MFRDGDVGEGNGRREQKDRMREMRMREGVVRRKIRGMN